MKLTVKRAYRHFFQLTDFINLIIILIIEINRFSELNSVYLLFDYRDQLFRKYFFKKQKKSCLSSLISNNLPNIGKFI